GSDPTRGALVAGNRRSARAGIARGDRPAGAAGGGRAAGAAVGAVDAPRPAVGVASVACGGGADGDPGRGSALLAGGVARADGRGGGAAVRRRAGIAGGGDRGVGGRAATGGVVIGAPPGSRVLCGQLLGTGAGRGRVSAGGGARASGAGGHAAPVANLDAGAGQRAAR